MSAIAKPLALLALLATILPPAMFCFSGVSGGTQDVAASAENDVAAESDDEESQESEPVAAGEESFMTESRMQAIMLAGAVLWFVAAPAWLKEND